MKEKIYKLLPHFFQNILISIFNFRAYKIRYGGLYEQYKKEKKQNRSLSRKELEAYQAMRFSKLVKFSLQYSDYYKALYKNIEHPDKIENIKHLPIISKEDLRENITSVIAKVDEKLHVSETGGTTGKSLQVYNFARNNQERFAFLDDFRSRFGYKLGKKTAWFSGKSLLTNTDIKKSRFWKTDYLYKVRYYSTFHIKQEYLKYYLENLMSFKPEYFVGFPSTMLDIAKYGLANNYSYPKNSIKAIFPTAETITEEMREAIESFFNAKIYDQYASSEGAPFIFECINGNLHLELQSGVFEVLDENNEDAQEGRLIITSFTNEGTPLIRYDIGDSIILDDANASCTCGNNNPLVKKILGRMDDYIYSPENGKINLGNISNTLKNVNGVILFQAVQNELNKIELYIVKDKKLFTKESEKLLIHNWRERIGEKMDLSLHFVENIATENSGKFRLIKNNIKHLVN